MRRINRFIPFRRGAFAFCSTLLKNQSGSFDNSHDWREPTLEDIDRSIPQVDCSFMAKLVRSRTASLAAHRKVQHEVLEKIKQYHIDQINVQKSKDSLASLILSTDEKELFEKGILTKEEWDTYNHSRPEYDDGYVIIDVRTVNEITSWGMIEGAKVLPAHEMYEAFKLSVADFKAEYGFDKPHPDQKIIFYCQFGPRSLMAAQIMSYLGYQKILHLRDGYHEWAKQYNLLLRRWAEQDSKSGNDLNRRALFQAAKELQREIAPEFNELPLQESERLHIDETRSRGTLIVGDGLREKCYAEVEQLSAGISLEDIKLPPSLNETMSKLKIETGEATLTAGTYNATASSRNLMNFMSQYTVIGDEKQTHAHRARLLAAREPNTTVDSPVNDFLIEDPIVTDNRDKGEVS